MVTRNDRAGPGLKREELTPGTFVTVSENRRVADRSLVDAIWVVVAANEAHAVLRFHCGSFVHDPPTCVVPLAEHDFYPANHLVEALEADAKQKPSATIIRFRD
jgi:hypothetical protein